ncbi:sensor histidine kinase [Neglectibacter caecimuris]
MERIKLYYGGEYGLTYQSKRGEGTTVRLCVPYLNIRSDL